MLKDFKGIKAVGCALALLHATLGSIFLQFLDVPEFKIHAMILTGIFAVLVIGCIAVVQLQEWGRIIIVFISVFLLAYLLRLNALFPSFVPLPYDIITGIVLLYFAQDKIRNKFSGARKVLYTILIVDDDEIQLKTVRPILLNKGYAVLTASTGEEGLALAKQHHPDLVILDVILPKMKGREVCRQLKQDMTTRNIPVIFVTAKDSADDITAEMNLGAEAHITKPVSAALLASTVEGVLGHR